MHLEISRAPSVCAAHEDLEMTKTKASFVMSDAMRAGIRAAFAKYTMTNSKGPVRISFKDLPWCMRKDAICQHFKMTLAGPQEMEEQFSTMLGKEARAAVNMCDADLQEVCANYLNEFAEHLLITGKNESSKYVLNTKLKAVLDALKRPHAPLSENARDLTTHTRNAIFPGSTTHRKMQISIHWVGRDAEKHRFDRVGRRQIVVARS